MPAGWPSLGMGPLRSLSGSGTVTVTVTDTVTVTVLVWCYGGKAAARNGGRTATVHKDGNSSPRKKLLLFPAAIGVVADAACATSIKAGVHVAAVVFTTGSGRFGRLPGVFCAHNKRGTVVRCNRVCSPTWSRRRTHDVLREALLYTSYNSTVVCTWSFHVRSTCDSSKYDRMTAGDVMLVYKQAAVCKCIPDLVDVVRLCAWRLPCPGGGTPPVARTPGESPRYRPSLMRGERRRKRAKGGREGGRVHEGYCCTLRVAAMCCTRRAALHHG